MLNIRWKKKSTIVTRFFVTLLRNLEEKIFNISIRFVFYCHSRYLLQRRNLSASSATIFIFVFPNRLPNSFPYVSARRALQNGYYDDTLNSHVDDSIRLSNPILQYIIWSCTKKKMEFFGNARKRGTNYAYTVHTWF